MINWYAETDATNMLEIIMTCGIQILIECDIVMVGVEISSRAQTRLSNHTAKNIRL